MTVMTEVQVLPFECAFYGRVCVYGRVHMCVWACIVGCVVKSGDGVASCTGQ